MLAGFDRKLTTLLTRFDAFREAAEERGKAFTDHEARIRNLETRQTVMEASDKTSTGTWRDAGAIFIAVVSLLLSLITILINVAMHNADPLVTHLPTH